MDYTDFHILCFKNKPAIEYLHINMIKLARLINTDKNYAVFWPDILPKVYPTKGNVTFTMCCEMLNQTIIRTITNIYNQSPLFAGICIC